MASYSETRSAARKFKLDPIEQAFVDAYANNGGDMLAAYDIASPKPELEQSGKGTACQHDDEEGEGEAGNCPSA